MSRFHDSANVEAAGDLKVLRVVFNDDLRACIQSLQHVFRYVRNLDGAAEADNLDKLMRFVSIHAHFLMEASITDGQPFMPDNIAVRGQWCPNLFAYTASAGASDRRWKGLTMLRALQILSAYKERIFTQKLLCQQLNDDFGYEAEDTAAALAVAWDYGLIEPLDVLRDGDERIGITAKGRFVMHEPFVNPAVTYFMGTGARLSVNALGSSSMFVLHDPRPGAARRFISASLKTGITVLRHAISTHNLEMNNPALCSEKCRVYALPNLEEWVRRAGGYGMRLADWNQVACTKLINDLRGIMADS